MHVCNLLEPEKAFVGRFRTFKLSRTVHSRHVINIRSNHMQITFKSLRDKDFNFSRYRLAPLSFGFKQLHRPTYYTRTTLTLHNLARGSFRGVYNYLFWGKFCYSTSSNNGDQTNTYYALLTRFTVSFSATKVPSAVSA